MIKLDAQIVAIKTAENGGLGIRLIGRPVGETKGPMREVYAAVPYDENLAKSVFVGRRLTVTIE